MDNCHENATCNNTFGSLECTCNAGFEGDGVNCTSKTSNLVMAFIDNLPDQIIMMYTYYAVAVKLPLLLSIDINECELRQTTAMCMLIALTQLAALNVPATVDMKEMESTVQVCMS